MMFFSYKLGLCFVAQAGLHHFLRANLTILSSIRFARGRVDVSSALTGTKPNDATSLIIDDSWSILLSLHNLLNSRVNV